MEKKRYLKKSLIGFLAAITLILLSRSEANQKKPEVPFVPTPDEVVTEMLKMAQVGEDDVLYDLGCGDGRIVITAAKKFGCRGTGIDIDPERIKESRENAIKAGVSNRVKFIQMDLFEAEFSEATVVTLYLLSDVNLRLRPKLLRELRPGTRVVSHEFSMGKWEPDALSTVEIDNYRKIRPEYHWNLYPEYHWNSHRVYLWIIPGDIMGVWKLTSPDISGIDRLTLKIDQEFQQVKAEAFSGKSSIPVFFIDEKIKGNMFQFIVDKKRKGSKESIHFEGSIRGDIMQGTLKIEGSPEKDKIKWMARRVASIPRSMN